MTDTTITKIDSAHSPQGEAGQKYLASGKSMSMRLWECEPESCDKPESKRDYETIGFVLKGKAELHIEGQMVLLNPGDCWSVPKGSSHRYKILETFSAVESTSPPAEVHGRDADMANAKDKECKNGEKANSSENNSVAEFAKATSVQESAAKAPGEPAAQGKVDKTTEVSPMDKGSDDELDGTAPPKEGETAESKKADAPVEAKTAEDKPGADKPAENKPVSGKPKESKPDEATAPAPGDEEKADEKPKDGSEEEPKAESPADETNEAEIEEAKDVQEIGAQIGRPDSKVTSNSPEKPAEPAEHVELDKSA